MADPVDDLLREQIAYYRAFAPEYDRYFDDPLGWDEWNRRRMPELERAVRRLREAVSGERVLEIACGTGWWTERLAPVASSVTAVDAAPEAIQIARSRAPDVDYVETDIFSWQPDARYDVVFFGYWLSHVPQERFEVFWDLVGRALSREGRVFFVDKLLKDDPEVERRRLPFRVAEHDDGTATRRVADGREFRIADIYYEPDELGRKLRDLGWEGEVHARRPFFYMGEMARNSD